MEKWNIKVNDKIYFAEEKRPYKVRATDGRYIICTKPYNPKKTVLYTIIDLMEDKRSPNDFVFNPYDYTIQSDIDQCLIDLQEGRAFLSKRHQIALNILKVL